jgi:tetratricopeptide (TPR) repeat protein
MMIRSTLFAAVFGVLAGLPAFYLFTEPARQDSAAPRVGDAVAETSIAVETWPICTSMDALAEGPAWAPLDPDFAAGKRALAAGDWTGAISILTSVALRDDRNADIQNYLGYAYRRLRQLDPAFKHYQQALALNLRHRSAHEHLGEAYLVVGDLTSAKAQLAALERICLIPCDEYGDLEQAIAIYQNAATR